MSRRTASRGGSVKQERLLAVLAQTAEVDAQAQFRGKFLHRAAQPARLLADVQFGGMETEHGDAVEPLLDQAVGQGLMAAFPQRFGDQLHVGGKFLGTTIGRHVGSAASLPLAIVASSRKPMASSHWR